MMTSIQKAWLPHIANELVDDILSYLNASDQNAMLQTCWNLHCVSARRLYMHVSVANRKARRFLQTIGESNMNYGMYTRTLGYSAAPNTDAWLTYVALREALPHLTVLETLTITVRSELWSALAFLLKKSTTGDIFEEADFETYHGPLGSFHLERLRTLNLHGDLRMLRLFRFQSLTTIHLSQRLDDEHFDYFLYGVATNKDADKNMTLEDLTITFRKDYYIENDIGRILKSFSRQLPNLRILTIRYPTINALKVSNILAANPPILPMLEEFWANDLSLTQPLMEVRTEDENVAIQQEHVHSAGISHPNLTKIGFGPMQWNRIDRLKAWVYSKHMLREDVVSDYSAHHVKARSYKVSYDEDFDIDTVTSTSS